jgi:hypothetical protein
MGFRNVVNDGSTNAPRLRMQCGLVTNDGEVAGRLDGIAATGCGGVEVFCGSEHEADELARMIHDRNLAIGFTARAADADDLLLPIDLAHRMRAGYLSVQVTGSLKPSPEIAEILDDMYDLANDAGLPLFIETRRGTVTQDLRRTMKVVDRFKKVRFTGDFRQYLIAADITGVWSEEVWEHFRPIAVRCGNWMGGVEIVAGGGELTEQFKKLWMMGMAAWLKKSEPGDVLPVTCEGGAIELVKRLAEDAWSAAQLSLPAAESEHVEVQVTPIDRAAGESPVTK